MTRTNLIRFRWMGLHLVFVLAGVSCAAPITTSPSGQPQNTGPDSAVAGAIAAAIATASQPKEEPSPAPSVKKKKKRARARVVEKESDEETSEVSESDSTSETTAVGVAANEITVNCIVRLPDDETDHPELCRDFRISVLDDSGLELTRFRFDGDGSFRLKTESGKKYRLKPLIGSNWKFVVEPARSLKEGDQVRVVFTQTL